MSNIFVRPFGKDTIAELQIGYDSETGVLKLYSEQGVTDYIASIRPNSAMTEDASFYLPSAKPAATYIMTMTSAGIMGFDVSSYLSLAGNQNVAGIKTFSSFPITPSSMPSSDYQVANKAYVDSVAVGLTPKDACRLATTAVIPACTYAASPAFTLTGDAVGAIADIDSVTPVNTNRILVKNQADQTQNGIYTVTTAGDGGTAFVLTRATDYDSTAEVVRGTFTYISAGTSNAGYQFIQTEASPVLDANNLIYGVLYAPLADTLQTVTNRGAVTTAHSTFGGVTNTNSVIESGIKNLVFGDSPYTVLSTDRHIYGKTAGGAINVILPPATGSGMILSFNKRDTSANIMTIIADITDIPDLINGATTKSLENIYDSITIQDCASNEWSNVIRSSDVASNTYRVSASGRADYKTIGECITFINSLSQTVGVRIVVDGGEYTISSTITVNATMPITIEGGGVSSTIFKAGIGLINSNMFELYSNTDFIGVGFDGTVAGWTAGTTASFIKTMTDGIYCEFKDFIMDTCKIGIDIVKNCEIFAFNFNIMNATVSGISTNTTGAVAIDAEVGNFESCAVGIHLLKSSAGDVFLNAIRFLNGLAGIGILYVPATFTYSEFTIISAVHNHIGTFLSGFDFTTARDSNVELCNCIGEENKSPHAKVNLSGNTTVTSIATNTWTKATFVNTSSYTCKFSVANNRLTYQSDHGSDVMMWISGNIYISTSGTKEIQLAIVKNGTPTTVYGLCQVSLDVNARMFSFSTCVYLDDIDKGNFFEVWIKNLTNGDDPVIADLNWLTKSTS